MAPTAHAQALFPLVDKLFSDLDDIRRLATNLRSSTQTDALRILTVLATSQSVFSKAVALFKRQFPDVGIHHQALHPPQIIDSLVLQEADVGYLFGACSHAALGQAHLHDERIDCVAPKGMLAQDVVSAAYVESQQLLHLPLIALDSRDLVGRAIVALLHPDGAERQPAFVVQTHPVALALAHQGLGIALVEGCTAASAALQRVDVLAVQPGLRIAVLAAWSSARPAAAPVKAFTRCMQQVLAHTEARSRAPA